MAATQPLLALNFLADAAHLLREVAPETSAYLMSECSEHLSRQGSSASDIYRQHVCTACGHIMIPGNRTTMKLEIQRVSRKKQKSVAKAAANPAAGPCKTLTCGHCNSVTRVLLPAPAKPARSRASKSISSSLSKDTVEKPKPTTNASSKKRAKNRKAGLQALLSSQQKPSSGLSLANFMK